jgi:hypothetical protein
MTLLRLRPGHSQDRGFLSALEFCFWVAIGCILSA